MDHTVDPMDDMNQEPSHLHAPGRRKSLFNTKTIRIAISAVVALVVIGGALFLLLKEDTKPEPDAKNNAPAAAQEEEESTLPPSEAAQPVTFKSEKLGIEITHRKDWKLKEDSATGHLTLTSPKITYMTKDGASTKGVFTLKFSKGGNEAGQQTINSAKAVKDSLLIAYAAPTEQQRHYTNISYAGQEEVFNFLVVTGSVAFKSGDSLDRALNLSTDDFLIVGGYGTDSQNALAFDDVDPSNADQTTGYEEAVAIIKSLKIL